MSHAELFLCMNAHPAKAAQETWGGGGGKRLISF